MRDSDERTEMIGKTTNIRTSESDENLKIVDRPENSLLDSVIVRLKFEADRAKSRDSSEASGKSFVRIETRGRSMKSAASALMK
jgi:hypothetical protein